MAETFDGDWLALREGFDAAARSQSLARTLAAVLPPRPRLVDLGAGTASLFRWLAPILGGAQRWTLVDADATLLARAFDSIADWAAVQGHPVTRANWQLTVHTPHGAWQVGAEQADLAAGPAALGLGRFDAVLCSALLDLVSAAWVAQLAGSLKVPLFACLSVDGRDAFLPAIPGDRLIAAGFRRDQGRDKGLGRALGPRAPAVLATTLRAHGFTVRSAPSDWRIGRAAPDMLMRMVEGHAEAALRHLPRQQALLDDWTTRRLRQAARGRLALRIGHRDSLALPPGRTWPEE